MSSKLPSKLSTEDLLASLEEDSIVETTPEESLVDPIVKFITRFNIEAGTNVVRGKLLYKLFRSVTETTLSPMQFVIQLSLYLPRKNDYFTLNVSALALGEIARKVLTDPSIRYLKSKHYKKSFEKFLSQNNIVVGKDYVKGVALFYWYDDWTYNKNNNKGRIPYNTFVEFLNLYFPNKRLSSAILMKHYGINRELTKDYFTDEKLKEIDQWWKNHIKYRKLDRKPDPPKVTHKWLRKRKKS